MDSFPKQVLLSLLFILFLNLSFFGLRLVFFQNGSILGYSVLFLVFLLFCLIFFVFWVLSFLPVNFAQERKIIFRLVKFLIPALCSFSIFIWFGLNVYTAIAALIFLLFILLSASTIEKKESLGLKFDFSQVFRATKWTFLTAFAALIAFVAFLSPKLLGGRIELPRSLYDAVYPKIEERLILQYPGFSGEMTLDEFILLLAFQNPSKDFPLKNPQEKIKNYSDFKILSKQFESKVGKKETGKLLKESRKEFLKTFGIDAKKTKISGDEKMKDVFYKISSSWFDARAKFYQYIVGIIAGLIIFFFFIARFTLSLVSIFYLPIAWIFFKVLRKINFFKIDIEKVDREKITI